MNNEIKSFKNFNGFKLNITSLKGLLLICKKYRPEMIIHLAAQAGVRYSIKHPNSYVSSNLKGTFNILEISKIFKVKHLLIASTSSVYGSNTLQPFTENQKCDNQLSFYAATKKSCEVMSHSYSYIYKLPITIFRFFTVYGPWGRPDMALFKFTNLILKNKKIDVYNNGDMQRDFTFVDDLVNAIFLLSKKIPELPKKRKTIIRGDSISKDSPFRIINIGNNKPIKLLDFIKTLEKEIGSKAEINYMDMQIGDVKTTWASNSLLFNLTGFRPSIKVEEGIKKFVKWYKAYYVERKDDNICCRIRVCWSSTSYSIWKKIQDYRF